MPVSAKSVHIQNPKNNIPNIVSEIESFNGTHTFSFDNRKEVEKAEQLLEKYIYNQVSLSKTNTTLTIYNVKDVKKQIKAMKKTRIKLYRACKNEGITNNMNERKAYEKIKNYIIKKLKYQKSLPDFNLALKRGRGNCVAYARLTEIMCDICGIECRSYSGYGPKGAHEWNRVKLNGKWYWSDLCWVDTGGGNKFYLMKKLKEHSGFMKVFHLHKKNNIRVRANI